MESTSAPFGISMGAAISSLDVIREVPPQVLFVTPPRPHPRFHGYVVRATPSLGVVWVKAHTAEIADDSYGVQTRAVFDEISAQLETRYGASEFTEYLMHESIWDEPRDWAMAIGKGERLHARTWERPGSDLPQDLQSVFLGVVEMTDGLCVVVEYASTNSEAADAEEQASLADLL